MIKFLKSLVLRPKRLSSILSVFSKMESELQAFVSAKEAELSAIRAQKRKLADEYADTLQESADALVVLEKVSAFTVKTQDN